jgi:hypothetical protein
MNDKYVNETNLLKAEILNSVKEIELLKYVYDVLPEYKGALNKRLETMLLKKLAEKYGTYEYKYNNEPNTPKYGQPSEYDKTINNVTAYLSKATYSKTYYKLTIGYKGTEWRDTWNADNEKSKQFCDTNKTLQLYSWEDLVELAQQIRGRIEHLENTIGKLKDNIKHVDKYTREHKKLQQAISEHNEKISHVLADRLRIK